MKPTHLLLNLLLGISYPAAVTAEVVGILGARVISFPGFLSFYVVAGVLAIAIQEYMTPSGLEVHRHSLREGPTIATPARELFAHPLAG